MDFHWIFILLSIGNAPRRSAVPVEPYIAIVDSVSTEWSEIRFDSVDVINKMAYADTANFMHQKIYPCARCFLRPEAAEALNNANRLAKRRNLKLVIYDCYRPYQFQYKMYEIVNNPRYVAKPGKGSNHNRGLAVDIALADEEGNLLDMGNEFDDFSELSHYAAQAISKGAKKNRKLLRKIMIRAGFTPYDNEWWHFDYVKKQYPVADFVWDCDE
ncbi:M15 family metallopeptidase [Flavobacterium salilacus subsp. salilacus]|uniref:M15 family metallopeptidase n=1 Tax=Flavobacterium TaxID=237 RepID=UPI001074ED98|nr:MULTISPECIES: M15 family metallopeptidase [Flavobacterium]KAF2519428.1 M15 family metallopeptidase [Flavobacterium salilacus subsp. salilacus]MBE1614680.1 M15 family metallopeptidase [Flavobacterium sp. SaA2.13]